MRKHGLLVKRAAALAALILAFAGCQTSDEGGGGTVSAGAYYGVGFYDPWYYGGDCDDVDVIVTPPDRPDIGDNPRPSHPIARPPASTPRPTPMPSIPSVPRVSGGRR
jgi:hypothetical protein